MLLRRRRCLEIIGRIIIILMIRIDRRKIRVS